MSVFEIIAIILNIISVYLTIKNDVRNWWVGLVGVIMLGIFFYQKEIYGQMIIQIIFLLQTIHGVLSWKNKGSEIVFPDRFNVKWYDWAAFILTIILLHITFYMTKGLDYPSAVLAMFATYLMARKFTIHWFIWIMVDILLMTMFFKMKLYGMTFLYLAYLIMCFVGIKKWDKIWTQQQISKNKQTVYGNA